MKTPRRVDEFDDAFRSIRPSDVGGDVKPIKKWIFFVLEIVAVLATIMYLGICVCRCLDSQPQPLPDDVEKSTKIDIWICVIFVVMAIFGFFAYGAWVCVQLYIGLSPSWV